MRQGCPSQGDTEQVLASSAQSLLGHCPLTRHLRRPRRVNRSPPTKGREGDPGKGRGKRPWGGTRPFKIHLRSVR